MTYNEVIEVRNSEVETLREEAKAEVEAAKEKDLLIIHALLGDGFPIEVIAEILKIEVSYAIELAKPKI